MVIFWNAIRKVFNEDKTVTSERQALTKRDTIILLFCSLYLLTDRINVDPSHFAVQRSAVYDIDHNSLFEFVNHAATVERWFHWVSHYQSIDRRPPGVGKRYRAFFYIPYIGYEKVVFRVADYSAGSHIVLKSSHALRPTVEASVIPLDTGHTLFSVNITFNQSSLLYQLTIGLYLRYLASKHVEEALLLLNSVQQQ